MTQVIFPTIVYKHIISLIIHCTTVPVGYKFTYTKLTVPLNSLENSRKLYHGFWSFWWANWRCTCGCISRPTFKLSAYVLDIMGQSKEISQDRGKKCVNLQKSDSSLGAISKCLKVPHSSVQTIICKYKHHGTKQPSYSSSAHLSH
jgi:hypothetical protein